MVNRRQISSTTSINRSLDQRMSIVNERKISAPRRSLASNRVVTIANSTANASGSSLSSRFSNLKPALNKARSVGSIKKSPNRRHPPSSKPSFKGLKRRNQWKKKTAVPTASSLNAAIDSYMLKDSGFAKDRLDADIDAYMSMEVETMGNPGPKTG